MAHLIKLLLTLGPRYLIEGLSVSCVFMSLIHHLGFETEIFAGVVSKSIVIVWVVVFITFFFLFEVCFRDGLEGVVQEGQSAIGKVQSAWSDTKLAAESGNYVASVAACGVGGHIDSPIDVSVEAACSERKVLWHVDKILMNDLHC